MERKVITSMLTGYLISMLPVWEIGSRIQALTLTFAIFVCILIFLIWIEEVFANIKKAPTSANVRAKRKNNFCK